MPKLEPTDQFGGWYGPVKMLGFFAALGMDKLTPELRSRNMSHIGSKDTKPEMLVRAGWFMRWDTVTVYMRKIFLGNLI